MVFMSFVTNSLNSFKLISKDWFPFIQSHTHHHGLFCITWSTSFDWIILHINLNVIDIFKFFIMFIFSDNTWRWSSRVCRQTRQIQQNNERVPRQSRCTCRQREEKESRDTSGEIRTRSGGIPFYTSVKIGKKCGPSAQMLKMRTLQILIIGDNLQTKTRKKCSKIGQLILIWY